MPRRFWISLAGALSLTVFIVVCRHSKVLADAYAVHIYPVISAALSWLSSPVQFSLQGVGVIAIVLVFIGIVVYAVKKHCGWKRCLAREAVLLLWVFVWFYMCWCLNYSRSTIYQRVDTDRSPYDSTMFAAFLTDYTEMLNRSYIEEKTVPEDVLEKEIKAFYARVPGKYGLCSPKSWQHSKRMMGERMHSAIGIYGYMGPMFSEFHLNGNLLPEQVPFTWAHEYSHLLGVSSEDEANWWAWNACMSSDVQAIRYSAAFSMFNYVWSNAKRVLSDEDFKVWTDSVSPEIMNNIAEKDDYWIKKMNPLVRNVQMYIYDLFLKGNNISSGTENYSEVIQMLISVRPFCQVFPCNPE